nr:transposase [Lacrimispora sp.]
MLDHEAEEPVYAEKCEQSGDRKGYRFGHYNRNLYTTAGEVTLKMPNRTGAASPSLFVTFSIWGNLIMPVEYYYHSVEINPEHFLNKCCDAVLP